MGGVGGWGGRHVPTNYRARTTTNISQQPVNHSLKVCTSPVTYYYYYNYLLLLLEYLRCRKRTLHKVLLYIKLLLLFKMRILLFFVVSIPNKIGQCLLPSDHPINHDRHHPHVIQHDHVRVYRRAVQSSLMIRE